MDQTTMTKVIQSQSMESIELQSDDVNEMRPCNPLTSDPLIDLMGINRTEATFEPLKVCLDDDSSIEDGDEDMFDDDAFYFGDEDFQALLSRIPAKTPVVGHNRVQNSFLPLHNNVSPTTESIGSQDQIQCIESAASSTTGGMTSSGPSSSASLGNLTLLSQESTLSHISSASTSKKPRSKRRVSLHSDVAVVPIPSRTDYPSLVKERIWSSAIELYQNAARNSLEFASEGWNWRNATEDEKMIVAPSGERIHPIHLMHSMQSSTLNAPQENNDACKAQAKVESPISMDTEVI